MNSKRANRLFLSIILIDLTFQVLVYVLFFGFGRSLEIGAFANLAISQLMLFGPALICLILSRRNAEQKIKLSDQLGFHKIKLSSFFMIILYTLLITPMSTVLNAISMLFAENAVDALSESIIMMPFPVMFFMIAMFGPFSEEFVFRGVIYNGYKNSSSVLRAVICSALLFGLMHLNFNQAVYAIAIGIMFALLVEATGSLWASVTAHMLFNMPSVFTLYLRPEESADMVLTNDNLIMIIGPYLIVAVVCTALAWCVLVWLAKNEGREEQFGSIWARRKEKKEKLTSVPLIIAIIICLLLMSMEWILPLLLPFLYGWS
ncbi:MAG: CPBP family intramembrane metalloprotease [Roseburia sp.]|nr:CPBP family intramembrane metalloprotease [Ruminococcus sp.]MCM1153762.1 CPBP family intramembrane metalloprotease [Roseburia sp.]MCM1241374.1 CPBP family intramembrane metalloprotease [Roseburia sp.]